MTPLSHRDRLLRAISHQEVDRVPATFIAEPDVQARVQQAFGLEDLYAVIRHFGCDTTHVGIYKAPPDLTRVESAEEVDALPWFGAHDTDFDGVIARLQEARDAGLAVLGGAWATIFTGPRREMGEAKFLMALLDEPDLIARVVEKTADCYLEINAALFSRAADLIDVFYFGSDFGTQRSLFLSAATFRRFFKPHMARLVQQAKEYELKVMFHTCGAVSELIPDFIAIGVDALDPVQVSAAGMSPGSLAARFKGQIAFHGGISTQTTLPHGTPEQVRAEVAAAIEILGPTGYVCAPDQAMMGDTPLENIVALYDTVRCANAKGKM